MKNYIKNSSGFGLLEVIVASGLWLFLASAGIMMTTGSLRINSQSTDNDQAILLASEGLDAARTIKKIGWTTPFLATSCVTGCGVATVSATWGFSGTDNVIGKYTRQILVTSVNRDVSGNIVTSGGTVDADTYKVESKVTWNRTPVVMGTVSLVSYLTNYVKSVVTTLTGGILIYGDGTTTPKYRTYDRTANVFSAETLGINGAAGRTFQIKTSSTKTEAIAGYTTVTGVLQIMCFDGTTWSNDWSVNVGGTATTRRFDIAYETNSGDVMVLYSTNTPSNNELAYRTKPGTAGCGSASWAGATNLTAARTNGTVQWVKMSGDSRSSSNLIAAIWADNQADLSAIVWSGTAWVNEPTITLASALDIVTVPQDVDNFDIAYESLSGDVMIVWGIAVGNNTNGVRYATCTGGAATCTWSGVLTPATFNDDAVNLDIAANPNSDEIVFASIGTNQSDLQIGYWSGTTWTTSVNADTSCNTPIAGSKLVATGWVISGALTRSIVRYADQGSSGLDWFVGNSGSFSKQTDWTQSPAPNGQIYLDIQMDPVSKDQLISLVADNVNDLFAKRLVLSAGPTFTWTNSDVTALELTLPQTINSPFAFAYWRQ